MTKALASMMNLVAVSLVKSGKHEEGLLQYKAEYADTQTMTGIDLPIEFQGAPFFQ